MENINFAISITTKHNTMNQNLIITPKNVINIPVFVSYEQFDKNRDIADSKDLNHCPCCGRKIQNPKFFINSIYGGQMYPKNDKNEYNDAWIMGVGSECRKKLPLEYVMNETEL